MNTPQGTWLDLAWDQKNLDLTLNRAGDDLIMEEGIAAVENAVARAVRSSPYAFQLIGCPPREIERLLIQLEEELEKTEPLLELGQINLEFNLTEQTLSIRATVSGYENKPFEQVFQLLDLRGAYG